MLRALAKIDLMVRLLVLAIVLASLFPATGAWRSVAQHISNGAIFLLFLLNGLRLPRAEVRRGIGDWRFLLPLTLWCFIAMAALGKGFALMTTPWLPPQVALGLLYLGVLPSTVQSATAYSSLAGGNVASSVVAAALLNVLGVFVSAPLLAALGGSGAADMGAAGLLKVFLILILPFGIGQALQVRAAPWVGDHRPLVTWLDRVSIAIAVYVAMSGAVEQGLWQVVRPAEWAVLLAVVCAFLAVGFTGAWLVAGTCNLARPERIAFTFAGAHKSIAMGAPLAAVLFPPEVAGMVLLPLLAYHLLQLVVSAPLASRLARRPQPLRDGAG